MLRIMQSFQKGFYWANSDPQNAAAEACAQHCKLMGLFSLIVIYWTKVVIDWGSIMPRIIK